MKNIYVTGNPAIDAMKTTSRKEYTLPDLEWAKNSRLILIIAHCLKNLGKPMKNIFRVIRRVMDEHSDVRSFREEQSCWRKCKAE